MPDKKLEESWIHVHDIPSNQIESETEDSDADILADTDLSTSLNTLIADKPVKLSKAGKRKLHGIQRISMNRFSKHGSLRLLSDSEIEHKQREAASVIDSKILESSASSCDISESEADSPNPHDSIYSKYSTELAVTLIAGISVVSFSAGYMFGRRSELLRV